MKTQDFLFSVQWLQKANQMGSTNFAVISVNHVIVATWLTWRLSLPLDDQGSAVQTMCYHSGLPINFVPNLQLKNQ